jgi:hypothetical protein
MATSVDSSDSVTEATISQYEVAILVPCFNEELIVGKTVADFRELCL